MSGALRDIAAAFGIEFDAGPLIQGNAAVDAMRDKLRTLGVQMAELRTKETALALAEKTSGKEDKEARSKLALERAQLERTKSLVEAELAQVENAAANRRKRTTDNSLTQRVRRFAVSRLARPGDETGEAEERLTHLTARTAVYAGAVGAAAYAVRQFASEFAAEGHAITATAATMRVTTNQLQEMQHAGVMAGLTLDESTATFAHFAQNARAAAFGGGEAAGALWRLGIRTRDANRQVRSSSDILDDVAARFDRVQNPVIRARLATQLFGEAGTRLIPILHAGAGGLAEWRAELASLGGGFSPEALASTRQYEQSLERWRITSEALRSQLATAILPVVARFVDLVRRAGVWIHALLAPTHGVRNALSILGAVGAAAGLAIVAAWAPVILPFLAAAAAIAVVYLIVDDVITLFEGGQSVIGDFIDKLLGVGAAGAAVDGLEQAWFDLVTQIRAAATALHILHDTREDVHNRAVEHAAGVNARRANRDEQRRLQQENDRTRQVTVPARSRGRAGHAATATHGGRAASGPTIIFHGVTDTGQIVNRIQQVLDRSARAEADADHPQNPREE